MTSYKQHVKNVADIQAVKSHIGRDIADGWDAEAPSAAELQLWHDCERNLRLFLESFFPAAFPLAWSDDHRKAIAQIEATILDGGLSSLAMPRGSGKTSIIERAALWALLYGHRRFPVIVGAEKDKANSLLVSIKSELQHNELLRRPFRYATYPIRRLDNEARRCSGQHFGGKPTGIGWGAEKLVLPTLDGSPCSGSAVSVCGITGSLRGQKHTLADGSIIRPDLCLLDDIQTRESALSVTQTADRLAIIRGDVLGLAGPGKKIAAFALCTVIREDDAADQLLDRQRCPEWQGIRTSAVYSWPTATELWDQYGQIRAEGLRAGKGTAAAGEFYQQNREAMDSGALVAWVARFDPLTQISAIQWAYDTKQDQGEEAFAAEYQNKPIRPSNETIDILTAGEIAAKLNAYPRGQVADKAVNLSLGIDIGDNLFHYVILAASSEFDAFIVEYGVFPDQGRPIASSRKAVRTLADLYPNAGKEGAVRAGLEKLTADLLGREFYKGDGTPLRIGRCLIDAGDGRMADVVFEFARASPHAAVIMPSRGRHFGPAQVPMSDFPRRPGEQLGHHWMIGLPPRGRSQRIVTIDTNYWKTFTHARLSTAKSDPGSMTIYGSDAREHERYASHLVGEFPTVVSANGRSVPVWDVRPMHENHFLDATVYAMVAASMQGSVLPGTSSTAAKRKPLDLSAIYASKKKESTRSPLNERYERRHHDF